MARDLREMFTKERESKSPVMKKGHEERFLAKLEDKLPSERSKKKTRTTFWIQIAASIALIISLGIYLVNRDGDEGLQQTGTQVVDKDTPMTTRTISLGDLSPDLKKIENYYLSNINLELSDLEIDANNKEIMDNFMERLGELDTEYRRLNQELNQFGPNDQTINALIKNLQLRLQLLQKLKSKLNQLKSSKNEQKSSHIV